MIDLGDLTATVRIKHQTLIRKPSGPDDQAGGCSMALQTVLGHLKPVASSEAGVRWLLSSGAPHGVLQTCLILQLTVRR